MTNSREKGKVGERDVAKLFQRWFPDARRGARQSGGGSEGADVIGTPFWPEVKRRKLITARVWANAWNQACRDMERALERCIIEDLQDVIVVCRSDGKADAWQVLCTEQLLIDMGYIGPGSVFQHPELVDGAPLRLLDWEDWARLLDRHWPVQIEITQTVKENVA